MDSWTATASQSPLATDWTGYFDSLVPDTGWWKQTATPFQYAQGYRGQQGIDYDPGTPGGAYAPVSGLTQQIINSDIDQWLMREHPELFDFTSGWQAGGVAGVGNVARSLPDGSPYGQFHTTPKVYDEMMRAAQKYGVPVNFLQAILAAEGSGKWHENNTPAFNRGMYIMGYIGVYSNTAQTRGFGDLWNRIMADYGNSRGLQIELLAGVLRSQYDEIRQQNPAWGWLNVASYHFSGFADPNANPWQDEFQSIHNRDYMNRIEREWKWLDEAAGNTWSNYTSTGMGTGVGSVNSQQWSRINQWDPMIAAAAQKYGVPANLIKAVMRVENPNGNPNLSSPQGATGLMQVMPMHVNGNQSILLNPETNIDVGTRILMDNYRRFGSWENAAKAYLAGTPTSTATDHYGTNVTTYWQRVNTYWQELNGAGSGMFGGSGVPVATNQMEAIWGGQSFPITQEVGRTSWSTGAGAWMYGYSTGLGMSNAHPGLDIGMPVGTRLYAPASGTVIIAGGSGSFYNTEGTRNTPGMGELKIRLDNGHELILGHMSQITMRVGDRVTPGMFVGLSGYPEAAHLHLEYRVPDSSTSTGWRFVDPRQYLGGVFAGVHQGAQTGLGYTQPLTFQNLMRAAASGQAIPSGPVYSIGGGRSSWNTWLRQAMMGNVPRHSNPGQYVYTFNPVGLPPSVDGGHFAGDGHDH